MIDKEKLRQQLENIWEADIDYCDEKEKEEFYAAELNSLENMTEEEREKYLIKQERKSIERQKHERRCEIRLTQKSAKNILSYMSFDFLHYLCFMICFHKYPYHLAYMRIPRLFDFIERIRCKNKLKLVEEYLFDHIEYEDEAAFCLQHYFDYVSDKLPEHPKKNDIDYFNYEQEHYLQNKNAEFFYLSPNSPKNLLRFKYIFMYCLKNNAGSTDFWHYICDVILMENPHWLGGWLENRCKKFTDEILTEAESLHNHEPEFVTYSPED